MNNKQKTFLIVGVVSFVFWIFSPLSVTGWNTKNGSNYTTQSIRNFEHYFVKFFEDFELNILFKRWYQTFSFSLMFGSGLGVILFKDVNKRRF